MFFYKRSYIMYKFS